MMISRTVSFPSQLSSTISRKMETLPRTANIPLLSIPPRVSSFCRMPMASSALGPSRRPTVLALQAPQTDCSSTGKN